MGIKAMEWVWDNYHGQGSKKLLLLAIAFRNSNDNICDLSMPELAKLVEVTERQCRVLISELETENALVVIRGGGRTTNRYSIIGCRGGES